MVLIHKVQKTRNNKDRHEQKTRQALGQEQSIEEQHWLLFYMTEYVSNECTMSQFTGMLCLVLPRYMVLILRH